MDSETLSKFIKENYAIDFDEIEMLRDGSDNTVLVLKASGDKKYVARMSKRDVESDIEFEVAWLKFLREKNIPVVPPVEPKAGRGYSVLPTVRSSQFFPSLTAGSWNRAIAWIYPPSKRRQ